VKPEESAVAKSTGLQEKKDVSMQDVALYQVLSSKEKISKSKANYHEGERLGQTNKCSQCKFNLADENSCHVVEGKINNDRGISNYFSPKGDGMLPGDVVWDYIKKTGSKLTYEQGYVIDNGAQGFQCKDCKYYMYSHCCLLIRGIFTPEMSCGFIIKIGNGTEI
jgi:hypothetical protein